jgi:hypothetical protein
MRLVLRDLEGRCHVGPTGFIAVIPARYGSSRLPGKPLKTSRASR